MRARVPVMQPRSQTARSMFRIVWSFTPAIRCSRYLKDEDRYRIRLSTGDVQKGEAVLRALLKEPYVRRNGG
jgi:hypothetical protein